MGTFIIRPTVLLQGGSPLADLNIGPPLTFAGWLVDFTAQTTILGAVNAPDFASAGFLETLCQFPGVGSSFAQTLRFGFTGASIYLDGSPTPIAFTSLPAGFTPTAASVKCGVQSFDPPTPPGTNNTWIQHASGDKGPLNTDHYDYDFSVLAPSILDIYSNGCGIEVSIDAGDQGGGVGSSGSGAYCNLRVEGTYKIGSTSYKLIADTPSKIGSKVTITSDKKDLNDVKKIVLTLTDPITGDPVEIDIPNDSNQIIEFLSFEMIFYIPFLLPLPPPDGTVTVTVSLEFDGITFTGSVTLGQLLVLFEDASGIYRLNVSQTNDELYFREGFTTDNDIVFIANLLGDDSETLVGDDFFALQPFPKKILSETALEETDSGDDDDNYLVIPKLRQVIVIKEVEIPSPFARTAFLP